MDSTTNSHIKDEGEQLDFQILPDDCLVRIFSFIPPIPFFFTTAKSVNKQLFEYFFEYITTSDLNELNYFKEMNFWDFCPSNYLDASPETKNLIKVIEHHLLFEQNQYQEFNILRKRLLQSTEILYLPFHKKIVESVLEKGILKMFERLRVLVLPPPFLCQSTSCRPLPILPSPNEENPKKFPPQTVIMIDWQRILRQQFLYRFNGYFSVDPRVNFGRNVQKIIDVTQIHEILKEGIDEKEQKYQNTKYFSTESNSKNAAEIVDYQIDSTARLLEFYSNLRIEKDKFCPLSHHFLKYIWSMFEQRYRVLQFLAKNGYNVSNLLSANCWDSFERYFIPKADQNLSETLKIMFKNFENSKKCENCDKLIPKNSIGVSNEQNGELILYDNDFFPKRTIDHLLRTIGGYEEFILFILFLFLQTDNKK